MKNEDLKSYNNNSSAESCNCKSNCSNDCGCGCEPNEPSKDHKKNKKSATNNQWT